MISRSHAAGRGVLLAALVCLVLVGCDSGPTVYPVEGTVTFDGRPVPTGNVMFMPDEGPAAAGTIAKDGTYRLAAVAGRHRVGVTALPEVPPGEDRIHFFGEPLVPAQYARPDTSGLVVEVKPESSNRIDLNLP